MVLVSLIANMFLQKCVKLKKHQFLIGAVPPPTWDTILILIDVSVATGTDRAGYELCVDHYVSGTRNTNNSLLFWILHDSEGRESKILGIRDQSSFAGHDTVMLEEQIRILMTFLYVLVEGTFGVAGI